MSFTSWIDSLFHSKPTPTPVPTATPLPTPTPTPTTVPVPQPPDPVNPTPLQAAIIEMRSIAQEDKALIPEAATHFQGEIDGYNSVLNWIINNPGK